MRTEFIHIPRKAASENVYNMLQYFLFCPHLNAKSLSNQKKLFYLKFKFITYILPKLMYN